MIISHRHRFILLKTRKTAGTSVEIALSKFCAEEDVITPVSPNDERLRSSLGYRGPQNTTLPVGQYSLLDWALRLTVGKVPRYYNHIGAAEVRKRVGAERWGRYFKFCFERNPYDKLHSMYRFRYGTGRETCDFPTFVRRRDSSWSDFARISIGGVVAVDRVYRYEELGEALLDLETRLRLPGPIDISSIFAKGRFRSGSGEPPTYSREACGIVQAIFAREIDCFGYSPWPPGEATPSEG